MNFPPIFPPDSGFLFNVIAARMAPADRAWLHKRAGVVCWFAPTGEHWGYLLNHGWLCVSGVNEQKESADE